MSHDADQATSDAAAVALARGLERNGHWDEVYQEMTPRERADYEAGEARHAARMRADGHRGW